MVALFFALNKVATMHIYRPIVMILLRFLYENTSVDSFSAVENVISYCRWWWNICGSYEEQRVAVVIFQGNRQRLFPVLLDWTVQSSRTIHIIFSTVFPHKQALNKVA
jgi:hypothetical protein